MSGLRPRFRSKLPRGIAVGGPENTVRILHAPRIGFGGVWPSANPYNLAPNQLARMDNMWTYEGALRSWPGDSIKGTQQSTDPVMGGFAVITDGAIADTVYFTTKDAHRWDGTDWAEEYEELQELDDATYGPAGTGATTNSTTTVFGIGGTTWLSRERYGDGAGNSIQASQPRANLTADLGDEFYLTADTAALAQRIKSIQTGGGTTLTLETAYANTTANANYTFRKHFRGTSADYFSAVEFQGFVYFCNGVDELKEWDTTRAQHRRIRSISDQTNINAPPIGACLETYANRVFMARLSSYTPATSFLDKRIAWCAEGNQYGWDPAGSIGAGNRAFIETPGNVQWLKRMDQALVIYKEFDIWFAGETGRATPAIEARPMITAPRYGLLAPRSVMQIDASMHLYIGQEDICLLVPFRSRPIGKSAVRDWLYNQIDRDNIIRAQAFYDETRRKGMWLVPLGNNQNAIILYDARSDTLEGPIYPGTARKVNWIGNFVSPPGDVTTIDELIGTIDAQTWLLGTSELGAAARDVIFGSDAGRIDLIDEGLTTFGGGETRTVILETPAVATHATMVESTTVRVTLVYQHPRSLTSTPVTMELSNDHFATTIGTAQRNLNSTATGKIEKAYFDFIVAAERVQARLTANAGTIIVLEFAIEASRVGTEMTIS